MAITLRDGTEVSILRANMDTGEVTIVTHEDNANPFETHINALVADGAINEVHKACHAANIRHIEDKYTQTVIGDFEKFVDLIHEKTDNKWAAVYNQEQGILLYIKGENAPIKTGLTFADSEGLISVSSTIDDMNEILFNIDFPKVGEIVSAVRRAGSEKAAIEAIKKTGIYKDNKGRKGHMMLDETCVNYVISAMQHKQDGGTFEQWVEKTPLLGVLSKQIAKEVFEHRAPSTMELEYTHEIFRIFALKANQSLTNEEQESKVMRIIMKLTNHYQTIGYNQGLNHATEAINKLKP